MTVSAIPVTPVANSSLLISELQSPWPAAR